MIGAHDETPEHHTPMSNASEMSDHFSPDFNSFLDTVPSINSKHSDSSTAAYPITSKQNQLVVNIGSIPSSNIQSSTTAAVAPISIGTKLFDSNVNVMQPSDLECPSNLRTGAFTFDPSSSIVRPAAGVATVQTDNLSKLLAQHSNSLVHNQTTLETAITPKRNSHNLDSLLLDSEDSISQLSVPSSCKSEMTRSTKSKMSTKSIPKTPLGTSSTRKREYLALTNNFNSFYNGMIENQNTILNALSEKNQEIISEIAQSSQSINDMGFKINDFVAQQVGCLKLDLEREISQLQSMNNQALQQLITNQTQLISQIQSLNQTAQTNQEENKNLKLMLSGSITIAIIGFLAQFIVNKSSKSL